MALLYAARAGIAGVIANILGLGMELIDVPTSVLGFQKYQVGPAWTGREFSTIQAAVDAAVADGHSTAAAGTNVLIDLYPVRYTENVVVPSTLPRWVMRSAQAWGLGAQINGTFTVTIPTGSASIVLDEIGFLGNVSISQPVVTASTSVNLQNCSQFTGTMSVTQGAHATLGIGLNLSNHESNNTQNFDVRALRWSGGSHGFTTAAGITLNARGSSYVNFVAPINLGGNAFSVTSSSGIQFRFDELYSTVAPAVVLNCTSVQFLQNRVYSPGPSVSDATTTFCEVSGNRFHNNGGASSPCWSKTGASVMADGGNSFEDGFVYPFISLGAGTRSMPQIADQLRNVLTVTGSPVLTAAQVGNQARKTTVAKLDGGGTVTLPALATVDVGCTVVLKDAGGNAGGANITFAAAAGEKIDAAASVLLTVDYEALEVQALNATDWIRIGHYP
jgi:hypothetical protein